MTSIEIKAYVTNQGGVVVLNGPFPVDQAKRIAALCDTAPQMLEMLQGILPEFRAYVETERDPDIKDRNESWIDGIEAVIAKATGVA